MSPLFSAETCLVVVSPTPAALPEGQEERLEGEKKLAEEGKRGIKEVEIHA